ncbi:mitochondrial inner membrane protein OXA1-like [Raphanus sativus]|uniref:Mitochondrial inner membrane protein OXA1-like n=1 Tax=Raphanus sativus TaxID=3726 RepID=A0A6J0JS67_RAPSA|nr:mitochondrial inner membrane protein OXA1-like [Raphanus sativus]XP_056844409.1 mitochondrial inner membrane protein OXA1-like [Raphanus sativus]XP_056844410.1 mitochondrial inner membrane protein OXA1-like [Raphanus sativus]KAJ4892439.1 mitochondrial inner membrane protein OXA1-like [Raphanus sativus]
MEYLHPPVYSRVYCVQHVINAIHDLTGLNWSMSVVLTALLASGLMYPVSVHIQRQVWLLKNLRMRIQKVRRVIETYDGPIDLADLENKILETELRIKFGLCGLSYVLLCYLYLSIPMFCITGISYVAKITPELESGGILWFTDLSTMDNYFYVLPLVTALTFWFTSKVPTTILSRMKELPLYCIFFIVAQTALKFKPAVYFLLIAYKISLYTLHLMCRSKQIAKLSKSMGMPMPYVPVTAFDQERIMAGMITIMGVFIDEFTKKDKK